MSRTHTLTSLFFLLFSHCFTVACASDVDKTDSNAIGGSGGISTTKTPKDTSTNLGGGGVSSTSSSTLVEGTCDSDGNCAGLTEQEVACEDAPMPWCVSACATRNAGSKDPECVNKVWKCPTGTVNHESCATDSCATSTASCCNLTTGIIDGAACGTEGKVLACGSGTVTTPAEGCIPASLGVTDCMKLQGMSCDGTVIRCDQHEQFCDCKANEAGKLEWECVAYLI